MSGAEERAEYVYTDPQGDPLYRRVRTQDKRFFDEHRDGTEWKPGRGNQPPTLYQLPEVLEAVAQGRTVYFVEGEKDVETLMGPGLIATTTGSATSWKTALAEHLQGAHVVLLPDNDEPGYSYMRQVGSSLLALGDCALEVLLFPGLAEHGDVTDWVEANGTDALFESAQTDWAIAVADKEALQAVLSWPPGGPTPEVAPRTSTPPSGLTPRAPFPTHVLGALEPLVLAIAAATGTEPDFAANAVLAVGSTVMRGRVRVQMRSDWREPCNLYMTGIAEPGEGKTPVMNYLLPIVGRLEDEARREAEPEVARAQARKDAAAAKMTRLTKQYAATDDPAIRADLDQASAEWSEIRVPALPRFHTQDATPEAIATLVAKNGGFIALIMDEGSTFFEMALRYSSGAPNLGVYLKGYDGSRFSSDRVGREEQVTDSTNITALLFAQPILLEDLANDRHFGERGLLARFLWFLPASKVGYRESRRPAVDAKLQRDFEARVRAIAAKVKSSTDTSQLTVSVDAQDAFFKWYEVHETRLRSAGGDLYPIIPWASKLPGQVLRLAGVLYVLATGEIAGEIPEDMMLDAIELSDYFVAHALVVFGHLAQGQESVDAEKLMQVTADQGEPWSTREFGRRTGLTADRVRKALAHLEEGGHALRVEDGTRGRGRPSEKWTVARNP